MIALNNQWIPNQKAFCKVASLIKKIKKYLIAPMNSKTITNSFSKMKKITKLPKKINKKFHQIVRLNG